MIEHTYKELYNQDSVDKQFVIAYEGGEITNEHLYSESFELTESLCSQSELRFGSCEASVLKFKIANAVESLKDKWLTVSQVIAGKEDAPFQYGIYKVYSDVLSGDRNYRNITAYDAMYDIINAEMVEWYDGLAFPITMKDFRDSFFAYLSVKQVKTTLVQDDMLIEKTIDADSISGKQIITAICELNGVFGHINRQGLFDYVSLAKRKQIIYPGMSIYPGSGIYPGMMFDAEYQKEDIVQYISCEHEDFETQLISKLQIRQEENDIGAIHGTGSNTYIVQDNFLVYGKSSDELRIIAEKLFSKINGVYYRPFKATLRGNPCIEVGDVVVVHTKYKEVESYVLERAIKGIQALRDTFESKGVYEYEKKVNSVQKEIRQLKGKTNVLERTVEQTRSELKDVENNTQSEFEQTAEKIEAKVSKGDVSSQLSIELGKILLKGNRIAIESDYFTLTEDGKLNAVDGVFSGRVISNDAVITGGDINMESIGGQSAIRLYFGNNDAVIYPTSITMNGSDGSYLYLTGGYLILDSASRRVLMISDSQCTIRSDSVIMSGTLAVSGTKARLAKTKSYNERLLYCYEMPSPIFGDVGHGVIGEDGLCYIDIDQIFFETVDMNQSYQVFLQSYSEHNVHVAEKQLQYFVVKGEPNTEFDWELKAKQLDFPTERLEENFAEDDYEETDYVALANAYLSNYEQEVLSYE